MSNVCKHKHRQNIREYKVPRCGREGCDSHGKQARYIERCLDCNFFLHCVYGAWSTKIVYMMPAW